MGDPKEFYLCGKSATRNHAARWRGRRRGTVTATAEGVALISAMQVHVVDWKRKGNKYQERSDSRRHCPLFGRVVVVMG